MASTICSQCGKELSRGTAVCAECGAQVSSSKKSDSIKLIGVILVVCVLAGLILAFVIQTRETIIPGESSAPAIPAANFQETKTKAEGGDARAQNLIGEMYSKGPGVPQDYKEAAKWYRLAADQGHAAAQKHLADLYEVGQGVPLDGAEALKWCQRAAEQGHVGAQYGLAIMFASGRGTKLNDAEAVKWYRMAAERGFALAQFNLGDRYTTGRGVSQDRAEAYKWLSLAAAQGIPDAAEARDQLKASMTGEQMKEGKRRVAAFVPTKPLGNTK